MLEDGELAESPKSKNFEGNEDIIIDKQPSGIIPNDDLKKEIPPVEDLEQKPSEWQRNIRKRMLGEEDTTEKESSQTKRQRMNSCFNCKGDHSIAKCPEPKDFARIRKNKMEFMNEKQQQPGGRISKITKQETKFKPGRLSQNLRSALNLGPDDIPEWVYRMRRLGFHGGYPPGYLKKSLKQEFETLKFLSDDYDNKEGEEERPAPTVQADKIHFYMGFNKTYGALIDRERGQFEIPPFDIFCDMLQTEVSRDHVILEKIRIRNDRARRSELQEQKESKKELETIKSEEDQKLVDNEDDADNDDVFSIDRVKCDAVEDMDKTSQSEGRLGESISQYVGTPVLSRRNTSGIWVQEAAPSLDAFAVGIVPFEAKEEDKPRGIFKRIMSTLKKAL